MWKVIPVNSKFCFDCGSEYKKPKVKEEPLQETLQNTETTKEKSNTGNKKNILLVVGVLVILAVVGGAVVMEGTFDKTISSIGDNKSLPNKIPLLWNLILLPNVDLELCLTMQQTAVF